MNGLSKILKRLACMSLAALLLAGGTSALADTLLGVVTSKTAAVYGQASMSEQVDTLNKNAVVEVMGYSTTIAKVSYNGTTGYMKISDLDRVDAKKAVLNAGAPVYQSPDTESASATAPEGTRLYVIAQSGDWTMVEREGVVGYVRTGFLQMTDENWNPPTAVAAPEATQAAQSGGVTVKTYTAVTTGKVKLYKSASTKSKKLATLKKGVQVTVNATSGGWAYIEVGGKRGFCKLSGLREGAAAEATATATPAATQKGTVSVEKLPVYKEAAADAAKLGTLKKGQTVNVVNWNSEWAYIELDGHYGYCAVAGLSKADANPTTAPTYSPDLTNAKVGTVKSGKLAVYQTASSKGTKLGTLKKGQTVNVIKTSDGWAYIELNGNYGFCAADGLSIGESETPAGFNQAGFTATVVSADARVYASTNTNSENVALKLGAEVQVTAYNDTWACIVQNGSYGFVPVKLLSKAEYAVIEGDGADLQTLLKALLSGGYYDAVPSNSYNAAAIAAIKRFQSACGLEETGVADQTMLRIVYSGYAPTSDMLFRSLSSGDRSDNVSRLQARLYALGYLTKTGSLDGEYGTTTVNAVKLFQTASALEATGTADTGTLKALYSTAAKSLPAGTRAADAASSGNSSSSGSSSTYMDSVPSGLASTTSTYSETMSNAEKLEYAIYLTQSKLGCPYVYGAAGEDKFDCSGLTSWAYKAIGVSLKRSAYAQGYDDTYPKIEGAENLVRGDLVFFNTISDSDLSDHAGVYIGNGYFIHASSGGHRVVVSNLTTGYYSRVFSWGRRVF